MDLVVVWFVIIAFFWVGYFVLDGFDFGVGMLMPILGRNDRERRVVINTIGPHFDANEVWVIVAGGATFAAFPEWYATLFSGFYLPLLLILVALIVRLVAIDYRSKRRELVWRRRWDVAIVIGSALPAFGWGVAFGNLVRGVPIDADFGFVGDLGDLLNPFALLTGLVTLGLFLLHGAVFVALKTDGLIRDRARTVAGRIGLPVAALAVVLLIWLNAAHGNWASTALSVVAAAALLAALAGNRAGREGWGFAGTATAVGLTFTATFVALFPDVMPSSLNPAWNLTVQNASSSTYTLTIMTWVAAFTTPVVLGYQAWTYWVFKRRLSVDSIHDDVALPDRPTGVVR